MAWIELHDTLPDHPKVIDLSHALGLDKDAVVGKLVRLWTWALNNRETGIFAERDASTIAEIMRYKGKPERLIEAMKEAHLLDESDGNLVIHDWDEHVCMLIEKRDIRREKTCERVKRFRERKASERNALHDQECNAGNAPTVPKPYHTVPSTPTECNTGADAPPPAKPEKPKKHKHGEYGWVQLTDAEYDRLIAEYGEETVLRYIKVVDEYVQGNKNNKGYKDWNLVVRKAIREKWGDRKGTAHPDKPNAALDYQQHHYAEGDLKHIFVDLDAEGK